MKMRLAYRGARHGNARSDAESDQQGAERQ
jgi:hypothetical protein